MSLISLIKKHPSLKDKFIYCHASYYGLEDFSITFKNLNFQQEDIKDNFVNLIFDSSKKFKLTFRHKYYYEGETCDCVFFIIDDLKYCLLKL